MNKIKMVDLQRQLAPIREEIDQEIKKVIDTTLFIKGDHVMRFEEKLKAYQGSLHAVSCGNGTDALQIALMSLDLDHGDEVIIPAFTYAAVAEVILLLNLTPVLVDVDARTFNIDANLIEQSITPRTRVIIPVHLFGQMADMDRILEIAFTHNLIVIEDNAQSIGALKVNNDKRSGGIGHIGCTSFFPSKNLGCFGDGGAITTDDEGLADKIRMITTHGQRKKYIHEVVGVNSRLDTIQAAVLGIKINHLDGYIKRRVRTADFYDDALFEISDLCLPLRSDYSTHVFNQYTIKVEAGIRDELILHLRSHDIPCAVYYPIPIHHQLAYKEHIMVGHSLEISESLCKEVLSLPMHTELDDGQLSHITSAIKIFF